LIASVAMVVIRFRVVEAFTTYLVKNETTISTLIQVLSAFTFVEQYS